MIKAEPYILEIRGRARRHLGLQLFRGGKRIDAVDFSFDKNIDTLLIASIDKFLKRNKIKPLSLKTIRIRGDIDRDSILYKILKSWESALVASKSLIL